LLAILLASSLLSSFAADRRPGSSSEIDIRKFLPSAVGHDKASVVEFFNRPWWREATREGHVSVPFAQGSLLLGQR